LRNPDLASFFEDVTKLTIPFDIIPPSLFGTFATKCIWDHLCIFDGDVVGVLSGILFFFTNIFGMTHLVNF
jgi:hypothetical protein